MPAPQWQNHLTRLDRQAKANRERIAGAERALARLKNRAQMVLIRRWRYERKSA